jgi:tryptophan 2,3-dioxygenase
MSDINKKITDKFKELGENPETYLKGLLHAKPINYWDYIEVDTLLSLQKPRTYFKDESIFIMYHQVTELTLKMMIHEAQQIVEEEAVSEEFLMTKVSRLNRYTKMLITSFGIMKDGMDYDDYNTFRSTLTPASGFQSAQFRYLELYCTPLRNLVNAEGRKRLPDNPSTEDYFEHLYWKDAGLNRKTGEKSLTLIEFEKRYLDKFIQLAKKLEGNTIEEKVLGITPLSTDLKETLKAFDQLYNVAWPLVHLNTAKHYLNRKGENKAATGGSAWAKYLHPKYQQRKFFPSLWSKVEKENWGQ